jgi:hypothetical protein
MRARNRENAHHMGDLVLGGARFDRSERPAVEFISPTAREERTASESRMGRPVGPKQRALDQMANGSPCAASRNNRSTD